MPAYEPAIEVDGLEKSYGDTTALAGVGFQVQRGEVVALLGPNGAGKTTTVEILEGYRRADSGTVRVLGLDPRTDGPALRQRVGIVLQDSGFEDELTVAESLRYQSLAYDHPEAPERVLEMVGLGSEADRRVKALSGGQRRRLDLGLAMVGRPELLFLDEPTTGFDPAARRRAWTAISELAAAGSTILLTTHYLEEARALAHRLVVIDRGRLVAEGPPDELGGRTETIISFRATPSEAEALGVRPDPGGNVRLESADPVRDLNALTARALEEGVDLPALKVDRPSLEDVYLDLVTPDGR